MSTELNLNAIKARADAATEGPWEESWKQIPGFIGYEVSNFGNVRSYYRKGNHKTKRAEFPRTLAKRARADGAYPSVSLPDENGAYKTRAIHRLVMLAFIGPCPLGLEVAHLNGEPSDNRLENLAYVTAKENASHKKLHGTHNSGESNHQAVLQGWQAAEIRYLAYKSVPQGKIGALFGISHQQVNDVLRKRTWAEEPARTDIPALIAEVERLRHQLSHVEVDRDHYKNQSAEVERLSGVVDRVQEATTTARHALHLTGNLDPRKMLNHITTAMETE